MKSQVSMKEAINGFRLSLANAEALLDDAKTLRAAGRPHRAIALSILSMEELGKLPRYFGIDRYRRRMQVWWSYFKSHETKIGMHSRYAVGRRTKRQRALELSEIERGTVGDRLHQLKMRSLYTDYVSGHFVSPLSISNAEELADSLIADIEFVLPMHRDIASTASPEDWRARQRQSIDTIASALAGGGTMDAVSREMTEKLAAKLRRAADATARHRRSD
jgi:AbiV family abortive infection protein